MNITKAAESESVFFDSFQAEQHFGANFCALLLCSPIS
jgi:hypothetical protein